MVWAERLRRAIASCRTGVLIAAHSLGCHAVLWWAGAARREVRRVHGALLVAPPDVVDSADPRLRRFALPYAVPLPFPAIVVSSSDDPYASRDWSAGWARRHGATWVELDGAGHINAASGLGDWPEGLALLAAVSRPGKARAAS